MTKKLSTYFSNKFLLAMIIIWSIVIYVSYDLTIRNFKNHSLQLARTQAHDYWKKDSIFREWATRHGGVYVPINDRTPPNPLLAHLKNRDIVTTGGQKLTLMNPAYMMNQMTKEFEEFYGIKGKITGLVLLDPDGRINRPDDWQIKALKQFDQGKTEVLEVVNINNKPYLRLMKPMVMTKGCVACHGHLGFKVGDIRGGVSVSIPLNPYNIANNASQMQSTISHTIVWFLGLITLVYFTISRQRKIEIDRQIQIERNKIQNAKNLAETEQLAHIGSWNFDLQSNKLSWSDEVYRIFGLEPQELDVTYEFFLDAIHPEDRELVNNAYYSSINEGRDNYEVEHRVIQKSSGNTRLVYEKCIHIRNSAGEIISSKGMVQDVTELKQTTLKLLESESRFRSYFELGLVGMAVTSIDKNWLEFNDTLCNMFGYSREEFSQLTWKDFTHPDDIEANLIQFERVLSGEIDGYSMEKRYIHYNGSIVHTLISVKAVRKIDGVVEQFVALVLDITDRKYAEDELLKARKLESVGLLAGGIAHDFNNILTGLFGNIELAKQKLPTDNAAYKYIKNADDALDRATNLTKQLLTFAKGGDPLIDRVNIEQVIHDSIKFSLSGSNVKTILNLPDNYVYGRYLNL